MKIGINGMGRIGRLVLRAALGGVLRQVTVVACPRNQSLNFITIN